MLQNAPTLAIVAVHTAENGPSKVHQVMNKIIRNIGKRHRALSVTPDELVAADLLNPGLMTASGEFADLLLDFEQKYSQIDGEAILQTLLETLPVAHVDRDSARRL